MTSSSFGGASFEAVALVNKQETDTASSWVARELSHLGLGDIDPWFEQATTPVNPLSIRCHVLWSLSHHRAAKPWMTASCHASCFGTDTHVQADGMNTCTKDNCFESKKSSEMRENFVGLLLVECGICPHSASHSSLWSQDPHT